VVGDYINHRKNAWLRAGVRKIRDGSFQFLRGGQHLGQVIPRRQKDVCDLKPDFVSHANLMTSFVRRRPRAIAVRTLLSARDWPEQWIVSTKRSRKESASCKFVMRQRDAGSMLRNKLFASGRFCGIQCSRRRKIRQ